MSFGVSLPVFSPAGSEPSPRLLIEFAKKAEALGFDSLWAFDVLFARIAGQFLEPIATLAAVAPETRRISLGTAVLLLPLRNPLILAKTIATLDVLSEGRMILGVGPGFFKSDSDILRQNYSQRFDVLEESIKVLRELWTVQKTSFRGRFLKYRNVTVQPRPTQRPHPPIWIEGKDRRRFELAATVGDGWIAPGFSTLKEIKRGRETIMKIARRERRENREIIIANAVHAHISSSSTSALRECEPFLRELHKGRVPENLKETTLLGTVPECIDRIRQRVNAGVSHFILILPSNDIRQMELLATEVLPTVRESCS